MKARKRRQFEAQDESLVATFEPAGRSCADEWASRCRGRKARPFCFPIQREATRGTDV